MNRIAIALLLCASFVAPSHAGLAASASNFSISLKRTGCLGECPGYEVTISEDGLVRNDGQYYVAVEGVRTTKISPAEVQLLIRKLQRERYFEWTTAKEACVDFPEVEITATLQGRSHRVIERCNRPGKVLSLASQIDRISGANRWVRKTYADGNPHLTVRLTSDKALYCLADTIQLRIARENTGESEVFIHKLWNWGISKIRVFDSAGTELGAVMYPTDDPPPIATSDFILLHAGKSFDTRIERRMTDLVQGPGEYELLVEYSQYLTDSLARKYIKQPGIPFWSKERGPVTSNRIKIRINP